MNTFLFAWNPSKFSWKKPNHLNEDIEEDIIKLKKGKEPLIRRWSCGVIRHTISLDDRVFLMMLGKDIDGRPLPCKGIIGAGYVSHLPFEDRHYDPNKPKETNWYINIRFESLLNPKTQAILKLNDLERINSNYKFWTPQSAKSINNVADRLENSWRNLIHNL